MSLILVQKVPDMHLLEEHYRLLQSAIPGARLEMFENTPSQEQLKMAEYLFGQPSPEILQRFGKLRFLQLYSSGADTYVGCGMPDGLLVATATGAYGLTISEHMLALLLSMMRRLPGYHRNQLAQVWRPEGEVRSVWGSTALILGLGDIGGEFARRIKALGGATIGVRRAGREKPPFVDELYDPAAIDELLPRADVVALSLPGTPATVGILSRARIARMKPGSYLINVGRGSAIDQQALCDALDHGRLAGAALDVTAPEPLPEGHRLWSTPNLLLTPHISGGTWLPETTNRIVAIAARNLAAASNGQPVTGEVDFSTGYRKL